MAAERLHRINAYAESWIVEIGGSRGLARKLRRSRWRSEFRSQQADHVVRGDDPGKLVGIIGDGQSEKIVFVEQLGHFLVGSTGMTGNQGPFGQSEERGG